MNSNNESDVACALVQRILNGDETAESEVVNRYQRGLLFMLRHKSKNAALASDISQETWRIVIEKLRKNELRDPSKLSTFIVQVGKNQLLMYFRRREQTSTDSLDDRSEVLDDINKQPEKVLERHNLSLIVKRVIDDLSTLRDRELITRFFINEQDKKRICHELNLDNAHFDRVLYRAKQRFKQLWELYQASG